MTTFGDALRSIAVPSTRPSAPDAKPRLGRGSGGRGAHAGGAPVDGASVVGAPADGASVDGAPVDGPTVRLPVLAPTTAPPGRHRGTGSPPPGRRDPDWQPRSAIRRRRRRDRRRRIAEWPVLVLFAVLVALVVRSFVLQSFYIPSGSMLDTLKINNRVVINKLSYRLHAIHRGDVVVFNRPKNVNVDDKVLIKRVIGVPGDTLSGHGGSVYVGSRKLTEPYVKTSCHGTGDFGPFTVPKGKVFVMGDNRCDSYDSRFFGPISQGQVLGRAFALIWPFSRFGAL